MILLPISCKCVSPCVLGWTLFRRNFSNGPLSNYSVYIQIIDLDTCVSYYTINTAVRASVSATV